MVMRLVMILVLLVGLAGCLKKAGDGNVSVEPATEEFAAAKTAGVAQEAEIGQAKGVVEGQAASQAEVFEKPSVQDIQQALKNANLYEGKIDGISGSNTRKAIEAFQSQNGLKPDGKIGPKTWGKLKEYLNIKAE